MKALLTAIVMLVGSFSAARAETCDPLDSSFQECLQQQFQRGMDPILDRAHRSAEARQRAREEEYERRQARERPGRTPAPKVGPKTAVGPASGG